MLERVKIQDSIPNRYAKPLGAVFPMSPEDSEWQVLNWEIAATNVCGGNPTLCFRIVRLVE
jgi:hypothetical protein